MKQYSTDPVEGETTVDPTPERAESELSPAVEPEVVPAVDELALLTDKYLRLQAEYQNYRKRTAREIGDARRCGVVETLESFMPFFDQLKLAAAAADSSGNVDAIRQGLAMIAGALTRSLDELGVRQFDSVGVEFDPNRHDAVAQEPSETVPEGVVLREWSSGYTMGDKVLRAARVVVSSGPASGE